MSIRYGINWVENDNNNNNQRYYVEVVKMNEFECQTRATIVGMAESQESDLAESIPCT